MTTTELPSKIWLTIGALLLIGTVAVTTITSCGSGGGSSPDGSLCDQCGVSPDGPCQPTDFVVPGANEPRECPTAPAPGPTCVEVGLICRRKTDSAQQRCFPAPIGQPGAANPDFAFRCDGSRPGGTALPQPTLTATPSSTAATPTPTFTPLI